jgi:Uma2 family endonuclease
MEASMTQVPPREPRRYTVEEYFKIEAESEIRHEYVAGRIIDPAGGTGRHSTIIVNVLAELRTPFRGSPCRAQEGNLRIRFGKRVQYGYADAVIVCGQPQFDPAAGEDTTLLNPRVLIEVLSDSTEAYDRGLKFERYRGIESFEEYVLVSQHRPSVEVYRRQPSGLWTIQPPYQGIASIAQIQCVGIELPLAEVYADVEFPSEPEMTVPALEM